jgi:hypothetical protein
MGDASFEVKRKSNSFDRINRIDGINRMGAPGGAYWLPEALILLIP